MLWEYILSKRRDLELPLLSQSETQPFASAGLQLLLRLLQEWSVAHLCFCPLLLLLVGSFKLGELKMESTSANFGGLFCLVLLDTRLQYFQDADGMDDTDVSAKVVVSWWPGFMLSERPKEVELTVSDGTFAFPSCL
jgi:hypothetical protein